jgi:colanic acid biosynthesis glycosyl transferase WcaI
LTFLLLNQTFYPDVMATGQYLTDVALRLVERGHQVTVVTSSRAYDHPETRFPKSETWRGIRIYRVGSTGFGKGARWRRAADFASFLVLCCLRLACLRRHDAVVALTSPPLISFLGAAWARLHRSRFFYWVMDFNPDEAVAAGWLRPDSLAARWLDRMSRFSLRHSAKTIALDRFMRDRIVAKGVAPAKVPVIAPWAHDTEVKFDSIGRERFRKAHGLENKFVVMYSGNHSPCHPLDTLLAAARELAGDPSIVFCFVGGGSEWRRIQQIVASNSAAQACPSRAATVPASPVIPSNVYAPASPSALDVGCPTLDVPLIPAAPPSSILHPPSSTLLCLPYQPLDQLSASLSAADLHVVVMGDPFVGLVHPCKIYNVLSVGAPVLYIGPRPSHLTEILDHIDSDYLWATAAHGDVGEVVRQIEQLRRQSTATTRQAPPRACAAFSREALLPKLIAELESR